MNKTTNKKPTVTIGIPAYNEEANIGYLLKSILDQKQDNFILKEIIVVSDGSADQTVKKVKEIKNKKIKLIAHKQRQGKIKRLNQIISSFNRDIFIQFDADIQLKNKQVLHQLITPFLKNKNTALVCGKHTPMIPTTFIEKLAYFGVQIWEQAIKSLGPKGERYHCTGQIRAFSNNFLQKFRLPKEISSAEDVYSYYFAKTHNYKVIYAPKAIVYFRLPSTFADYTKQMKRFLKSPKTMHNFFGQEAVEKYNTITNKVRLKALLKLSINTPPYIVLSFLILQCITKVEAIFYKQKTSWDIASSSKILNLANINA